MFTGIVEHCVAVQSKNSNSITLERPERFADLSIGQSISCNGACLSVIHFDNETISFDVLTETFRKTNLGTATWVNVERAMPANGRFEGHVVLGHVDEVVTFLSAHPEESGTEYRFTLPQKMQYMVEKGSICLNGVSLTLGSVTHEYFSVYFIPMTLDITNFGKINLGDAVCLEYDYLGKLVLNNQSSGPTEAGQKK